MHKNKNAVYRRLCHFVLCVCLFLNTAGVSAQTTSRALSTPFYDPAALDCGTSSSTVNLDGNTNAEKAFNFFVQKGLTENQAAGIVGNIIHESGLDPENIQNPAGRTKDPTPLTGTDQGWGIVQWTPGNKAISIHKASGQTAPIYELETQLEMVWAQLNGTAGSYSEKQAGDDIKATTTLKDAVLAFQGTDRGGPFKYYFGFERPQDKVSSVPKRIAGGQAVLRQHATGTVSTLSSTSGNPDCSCSASPATESLATAVSNLADKNGGKTAISVATLSGTRSANAGGNLQMPTRSSYKLYTAYATMRAIEDGKITWSTKVWDGKTVEATMQAMIIKSDNDAAEALRMDSRIGLPGQITKLLQNDVGLSDKTVMGSGKANDAKGSNSLSTANDFVKFLTLLEKRKLPGVTKDISYDKLLSYMKQATTDGGSGRAGIAAGVGNGVEVADKPGWAPAGEAPASNDVGIVYAKDQTYIIAILTDKPAQWSGVADIASAINAAITSSAPDQSGADCQGAVSGDLSATTKNYAWPDYHPAPYLKRKPAYAAAVTASQKRETYVGGSVGGVPGIDCGGFVTILMLDSGFEPKYNSSGKGGNTISQQDWLEANWQKLNPTSTKDLQPGDVAINDRHTYVYVGKIEGFGSVTASASYSESGNGRAPMAGHELAGDPDFNWYRKR